MKTHHSELEADFPEWPESLTKVLCSEPCNVVTDDSNGAVAHDVEITFTKKHLRVAKIEEVRSAHNRVSCWKDPQLIEQPVHLLPAKDGSWLLVLRIGENKEYGGATVVVTLNRDGQISSARVPMRRQGEHDIPVAVTPGEIDRILRQQVIQAAREDRDDRTPWALAGLALIPLALVARRRA